MSMGMPVSGKTTRSGQAEYECSLTGSKTSASDDRISVQANLTRAEIPAKDEEGEARGPGESDNNLVSMNDGNDFDTWSASIILNHARPPDSTVPFQTRATIIPRPVHLRDLPLLRPIATNIDPTPREPQFQKHKKQIVDHDAQYEKLSCPDAAAVVPLQAIDEREVLARWPARLSVMSPHGLLLWIVISSTVPAAFRAVAARDEIVHPLRAPCDIAPAIHHPNLFMEAFAPHSALWPTSPHEQTHGLAGRTYQVVLLRLGEYRHVAWQDLWDTADPCTYDQQVAACRLHEHGAESLRQGRVQVDVSAYHDVSDFFVAYGSE